ncbi:MAG: helix-turn-helix domain-containing protein [Candidatus Hodarchaeota archaeon]
MINQKPIELHDFINQTRAAEIIGVSRMTIWQWIKEGKIQPVIVGGLRMLPQSEVTRLKGRYPGRLSGK